MSARRQPILDNPVRCYYADQPSARPDCTITAVVRYGDFALCASCRSRRSTVGKGELPRLLPSGPPVDVLDWIGAAQQQVSIAERHLAAAVARARQAGHSWSMIGGRLGISRQAAQQRFRAFEPAIPAAQTTGRVPGIRR
jgi:hypothetical protein